MEIQENLDKIQSDFFDEGDKVGLKPALFTGSGHIHIETTKIQASAESYLKLVKLFVARMQLAERNRKAGILTPIGELKSLRGNPQAVIADFDQYISKKENIRNSCLRFYERK